MFYSTFFRRTLYSQKLDQKLFGWEHLERNGLNLRHPLPETEDQDGVYFLQVKSREGRLEFSPIPIPAIGDT